jgi:DNA-binding transcriptional ArsR family regulator
MTQEQIGDAVGLTAVHVNRTLKALESQGLITLNRRAISFPMRWNLATWSLDRLGDGVAGKRMTLSNVDERPHNPTK